MPSLVLQGVQSIYKLTARKHKQLRQECEELIQSIQRDDEEQQRAAQQQQSQQPPANSPSSSSSSSPPPPLLADSDADKYFLPFKLACESDNSRMQAVALNQIEKLIAYGYLDGASVADPNVYPPRKSEADNRAATADGSSNTASSNSSSSSSGSKGTTLPEPKSSKDSKDKEKGVGGSDSSRRLISVIVDTVYDCSLNKDRDVQLQAVKCILTALTSTTCSVHGQTLVSASYACWNIYLQASDDTIRNTAKAALTQTFSLVFQRMESFGKQLKQMQQSAAMQPTTAATTTNNSITDKTADSGRQRAEGSEKEAEERKDEEKETAPQDEQKAIIEDTTKQPARQKEEKANSDNSSGVESAASNNSAPDNQASSPTDSPPPTAPPAVSPSASSVSPATTAALPTSPSSAATSSTSSADESNSRPPPGKRGYCVVCAKPANFFCLQTKDSVCSVDCKLVNLQRRDKKSTIASDVHAKIQKKFVILQTDAFMLLRALIRLSKKPLPSPAEPSAVDSKLLSLELLLLNVTPGDRKSVV